MQSKHWPRYLRRPEPTGDALQAFRLKRHANVSLQPYADQKLTSSSIAEAIEVVRAAAILWICVRVPPSFLNARSRTG